MHRDGRIQERLQRLGRPDELQVEWNRIGQGKCLNRRNEQLNSANFHQSKGPSTTLWLGLTWQSIAPKVMDFADIVLVI